MYGVSSFGEVIEHSFEYLHTLNRGGQQALDVLHDKNGRLERFKDSEIFLIKKMALVSFIRFFFFRFHSSAADK